MRYVQWSVDHVLGRDAWEVICVDCGANFSAGWDTRKQVVHTVEETSLLAGIVRCVHSSLSWHGY